MHSIAQVYMVYVINSLSSCYTFGVCLELYKSTRRAASPTFSMHAIGSTPYFKSRRKVYNALLFLSAIELLATSLMFAWSSLPGTVTLSDAVLGITRCARLPAKHASHCGKYFLVTLEVIFLTVP